ncbi:hypothetical protein G1K46_10485 [Tenacibaculum finnmarkense]|uniref:TlpA family protein disulfide reductase n=1 Tax=Tenacibaculum finnmarkense TaxID=2781243 RepID=UPI001EFA5D58|nr:hypothetical protein [Tenacibaculum finnmarkense]MCG8763154.1 hypothetical protein [Tenacibaculum finnmarkense]MCG8788531.1 hypothetical protein [Tenacibaculum finnmarkense]
MIKYLIPLLLILFIGCNSSKTPKTTYFGGKIINPKSNYITLSDNYAFNDTIYLKKDHSFLGSYKNLKKGLYVFGHGPEHQYVYLEPQDSLLFRLNSWDFDESLVFSGKDAARNNILIEAFLETEQDDKNFERLYQLSQPDFLIKIDSIKKIKEQKLIDFKKNNKENASKEFLEILKVALFYPVYTYSEQYAIKNFTKKNPEKLVASYFDYRADINLKKDYLIFFSPYYALIIDKLYNDVYLEKGTADNFTRNLLNNIDASISSEKIKNKLLYNTVIRHFFKEPNDENKNKTFFEFFKLNTNIEQKKNMQRLVNDLKLLNVGEKLPDFNLIAATGETKRISKLIKGKAAVILFKDYKYASDDWISSRTNFLIKNNPNVTFIIVNLCNNFKRYTKKIAIKHQYTLPKKSLVCNFSSSKFPRMVLIDKQGIIQNGYTSLSAKNINKQVQNLQNNKK